MGEHGEASSPPTQHSSLTNHTPPRLPCLTSPPRNYHTTPTANYELSRGLPRHGRVQGSFGRYDPARAILSPGSRPSTNAAHTPENEKPRENDAAGKRGQARRRDGRAAAAGVLGRRARRRRQGVGLGRGVQRVDEHRRRRHHVDPGGNAGARGGPRAAHHRRRRRARRRLGGVHAAVHGVGGGRRRQAGHVRGAHGRHLRPRRRRRAQRLHRLHHHGHARRLPHHHRGRDVRERRRRRRARRGAAGAVRRAVVDGEGVRAARHRRLRSPAACAPPPCRFSEVHISHLHPASGGVHAHQHGDRGVRALQGHHDHAEDASGLLQALLPVRALHRRPRHRRRLHLPLQRLHPIRAELSKTSDMKAAVRISLVLCAAIYAAVGFFGFLLFGDATMADVLANFDRSSGAGVPQALNDAARLSYALHLVLVFPLLLFSLRVNVDELIFPGRRSLATDTRRFVSLTAVLMAVLYALAIAIPSIWTLFEYSGSTFAVTISLIFPGAIVLRDVHGIAKRKDKALAATMIILSVVTSSIAIASNIMSSISDKVRGGHEASR